MWKQNWWSMHIFKVFKIILLKETSVITVRDPFPHTLVNTKYYAKQNSCHFDQGRIYLLYVNLPVFDYQWGRIIFQVITGHLCFLRNSTAPWVCLVKELLLHMTNSHLPSENFESSSLPEHQSVPQLVAVLFSWVSRSPDTLQWICFLQPVSFLTCFFTLLNYKLLKGRTASDLPAYHLAHSSIIWLSLKICSKRE